MRTKGICRRRRRRRYVGLFVSATARHLRVLLRRRLRHTALLVRICLQLQRSSLSTAVLPQSELLLLAVGLRVSKKAMQ